MLCLLCTVLLLSAALPCRAEEPDGRYSYDFDLSFSLNASSFPAMLRSRAEGYASLIGRLGLRGNICWNEDTQSMYLDGTIYFTDDESLSYPFKLFGVPSRLFITSPMIRDQELFLNMLSLMEFSIKAKNTLNVPFYYAALLYPYATESAFEGLRAAWLETIKERKKSGTVTSKQSSAFASRVQEQLQDNSYLHYWIQGLAAGSESPEAVESVFAGLADYCRTVTGGKNVNVKIKSGSETWSDSRGNVLYSREESENESSLAISLPADQYGYIPSFTYSGLTEDRSFSFRCLGSVVRTERTHPSDVVSDESDEDWANYEDEDGEEESIELGYTASSDLWPDTLLNLSVSGSGFPLSFPVDSAFSVTAALSGAVYPNFATFVQGETKSDGTVSLRICKPSSGENNPVTIFECRGKILPAEPVTLPDYLLYSYANAYSVFSFNEESLAQFRSNVLPSLIRSVFSFIAAAPTAACQSFLDDLTDMGLLDMLLN
jgi:hypothetical protein